jgi:hypothetical protein
MNEELDNTWIKEFENTDKLYQDFYVDDIYYINVHFVYINKKMEIEKRKEEIFFMKTPNVVSREEMLGLLKRNILNEKRSYRMLSLLKFNLSLEPEDISSFVKIEHDIMEHNDFLLPIHNIDTITFQKTISMFQDLNSLYFLFIENSNHHDDSKCKKNVSKRIVSYLKSKHRKTIKKYN